MQPTTESRSGERLRRVIADDCIGRPAKLRIVETRPETVAHAKERAAALGSDVDSIVNYLAKGFISALNVQQFGQARARYSSPRATFTS